jgi:hypothetical protein
VYAKVERLSEYASWTLLHGYAVNHVALSLFQLRKMYPETPVRTLEDLEASFASNAALSRVKWNECGGRIKRSPSGLLSQSALMSCAHKYPLYKKTVATQSRHGVESREDVFKEYALPGSYLEFVQRSPKPENAGKSFEELEECDLREGFEAGNANKIFDSTSTRPLPASGADSNAPQATNATVSSAPTASPKGILASVSSRVVGFFKPSSHAPVNKKPRVEREDATTNATSAGDDVIDLT